MSRTTRVGIWLVAAVLAALSCGFGLGVWFGPRLIASRTGSSPATASYARTTYDKLDGWGQDSLVEAVTALQSSCAALEKRDPESTIGEGTIARSAKVWQTACSRIREASDAATLRSALETFFEPYTVASSQAGDQGTITGYYEADLNGSLVRDERYRVPIYGVPRDLVTVDLSAFFTIFPPPLSRQIVGRIATVHGKQTLLPYFTREQIDREGAIATTADVLLWADDPVAVHILHIQGSGRVTLPDGRRLRLGFAGHNGQHFQGIGKILIDDGVLKPGAATMDNVRAWLESHPTEASAYMDRNSRYIFFQLKPDSDAGPVGALGVPLTPQRSVAVDQRFVPLGAPLWLETIDPDGAPLRRLVAAQDTGAAIAGPVRADFFWGSGEAAFQKAARMRSSGRYAILVPRAP